jgi:hypothetical protein
MGAVGKLIPVYTALHLKDNNVRNHRRENLKTNHAVPMLNSALRFNSGIRLIRKYPRTASIYENLSVLFLLNYQVPDMIILSGLWKVPHCLGVYCIVAYLLIGRIVFIFFNQWFWEIHSQFFHSIGQSCYFVCLEGRQNVKIILKSDLRFSRRRVLRWLSSGLWHLSSTTFIRARSKHHPDDGGSKDLWSVCKLYQSERSYNPEDDSHLNTQTL